MSRRRTAHVIALLAGGVLLVACLTPPSLGGAPTTPGVPVFSTAPATRLQSSPSLSAANAASAPSPPPQATPPPLNRLEVKVIDALARLGVTGQRAQLPYANANIYSRLATGADLFVNAWPTGTDRGEWSVIDERKLAGILVQRVQYTSSSVLRDRFACAMDTYEVSGASPPGFRDMNAFVTGLIRAMACAV